MCKEEQHPGHSHTSIVCRAKAECQNGGLLSHNKAEEVSADAGPVGASLLAKT